MNKTLIKKLSTISLLSLFFLNMVAIADPISTSQIIYPKTERNVAIDNQTAFDMVFSDENKDEEKVVIQPTKTTELDSLAEAYEGDSYCQKTKNCYVVPSHQKRSFTASIDKSQEKHHMGGLMITTEEKEAPFKMMSELNLTQDEQVASAPETSRPLRSGFIKEIFRYWQEGYAFNVSLERVSDDKNQGDVDFLHDYNIVISPKL